jgi:hypothetical protein
MAYTTPHPLNEAIVWAYLADVSADSSAFTAASHTGEIIEVGSVIYNAITGADAGVTVKANGTAITGGTLTITQSGSAAGDIDTAVPTARTAIAQGQLIEFDSDGASSTTTPTMFWARIRF